MDSVSEARLQLVNPTLAAKIRQMADILAGESITFRVTEGLRSWAEQAKLYAQGRTAPGAIVTNAQPGHSYHQFGLAVDVAPFAADGAIDWNVNHPVWKRLVEVGTSLGLTSGSQFHTITDWPHFQLTGTLPESPTDSVRQTFLEAGMEAVWTEAGVNA
jgi:peptidoglycan LD-endopeptidase CwlK